MKQVRLRTIMSGPNGVAQPGQVISVPDKEADDLVKRGFASLVEQEKKPEPEPKVSPKEEAVEDRSDIEKAVEDKAEPPKRKRGRPKKDN